MIHRSERLTWDKDEDAWCNGQGFVFCETDPFAIWGVVPKSEGYGKDYYTRGWRICFTTDFPHAAPSDEYDYVSLFSEYDAAVFGIHTTLPPRNVNRAIHGGDENKTPSEQAVARANQRKCADHEPGVRVQFIDSDVTDWVYEALGLLHLLHRDTVPVLHLYVWVEREDVLYAAD